MKSGVRVACAQMDVAWLDPESNLRTVRRMAERVADEGGAELLLFPELANSGYVKERDREFARAYLRLAEPLDGPFVRGLGQCAREHRLHVVCGLLQAHPSIPATAYNAAVLVSPDGELIGLHHKMHIPGEERHYFYAGNTVTVVATELGNLGLSVCADRRFPELARLLTLRGAGIYGVRGYVPNFRDRRPELYGSLCERA